MMHTSHMQYPTACFPNALVILDSFHVSKFLLFMLNNYISQVCKRYKEKDKKALDIKNNDNNRDNKSIKPSKEITLLTHYKWVILKNNGDMNYSFKRHYHSLLGQYADTYTIEKMFLQLDKNFETLRDLNKNT